MIFVFLLFLPYLLNYVFNNGIFSLFFPNLLNYIITKDILFTFLA